MVHVDVVDDDIGHVLNGDASAAGDVDVGSTAVDRFETVNDKLVFQLDSHVGGEDDPQRFELDHSVPESPRSRVRRIQIRRVGNDVDLSAFATHGIPAEPDTAVGQSLSVCRPIRVAPPAIIDGVSGETRESLIL